jgi:hypothetical protein
MVVDDASVEKLIYNSIEDEDFASVTELLDYCITHDIRVRATVLEEAK